MNFAESTYDVVIDTFDDPVTLDPHRALETGSQHAVLNVYDGLVGFDQERHLKPVLAAFLPMFSEHDGEQRLLIPIRDGVRFHDGAVMSVSDVVYSLRRIAVTADLPAALWSDALLGAPLPRLSEADALEMASRITATSDGVLIRLRQPYGPMSSLLVQWSSVVNRDWCAARGEWDGDLTSLARHLLPQATALDAETNGTGQYVLERWDRDARQLCYRKVQRDFAGAEPGPRRVTLRSVDDSEQREKELIDGTCDFSVCLTESRHRFGSADGVVVEPVTETYSVNPLAFITQRLDPNCSAVGSGEFSPDGLPSDAFTDVHLRRMLSLCFDHRRYADEVLDGAALPHALPFPATLVPGLQAFWPVMDLERARAEFAAAWEGQVSHSGCRIVIYAHDTNVSRVKAAALLAEGLQMVSKKINVELVHVDITTLATMLYSSQCPIAWTGWVSDFLHPYALASALLDPRAPLPAALGFQDPALSDLVSQAREFDPIEDPGPYRALHEYAVSQSLFLAPPGKIDFMMYRDRWSGIGLRNHIPHVLDFASFRPREK